MRFPERENSAAVLVGVDRYASSDIPDLPAVYNNVLDLRSAITDQQLGGFGTDRCTVVHNPSMNDVPIRNIAAIGRSVQDCFLVYFAGHAFLHEGKLLLALTNTDADSLPYTSMQLTDLRNAIRDSAAKIRILVLDCCYSGHALGDTMAPLKAKLIVEQAAINGTYTLTSSAANQAANAPTGERYTTFTGALIGLLRDGIRGGPELLGMDEIFRALSFTLRGDGKPEPQQASTQLAADIAIVRNRMHRSGLIEHSSAGTSQLILERHLSDIIDTNQPLDDRIDALESVARRAQTDDDFRRGLSLVCRDQGLPLVFRVWAFHRLSHFDSHGALLGLDGLNGRSNDPNALTEYTQLVTAIGEGTIFSGAVSSGWSIPEDFSTRDDQDIWGLVMAMAMTCIGLTIQDRIRAASELAEVGEPKLALTLLAGYLMSDSVQDDVQSLIEKETKRILGLLPQS